ncbi:MAG: hypothetical protein PVG39_20265 [Desulfobacteraceae bacterium]
MSNKEELAKQHGELHSVTIQRLYLIGDKLAEREGYKDLDGIDAVYYYLIQKHNWLPSQVKSMNVEDLSFCLSEEKI